MALSGQKTITTAGTAQALGSQRICAPLMLEALTTNTRLAYLGNDGAGGETFHPSNLPAFQRSNVQTLQ